MSESEQMNQGDNALEIELSDSECPSCGHTVARRMFSCQAYCPLCDTLIGRLKRRMGLVDGQYCSTRKSSEDRVGSE